jgi:hypothetical protein
MVHKTLGKVMVFRAEGKIFNLSPVPTGTVNPISFYHPKALLIPIGMVFKGNPAPIMVISMYFTASSAHKLFVVFMLYLPYDFILKYLDVSNLKICPLQIT